MAGTAISLLRVGDNLYECHARSLLTRLIEYDVGQASFRVGWHSTEQDTDADRNCIKVYKLEFQIRNI